MPPLWDWASTRIPVENTIYTALFDISVDPHDVVQHTAFENIDVIPANIDLSAADVQLVTEVGREQILNSKAAQASSRNTISSSSTASHRLGLLTVNALAAADGVIIPVAAEFFALRGVALLMQSIEKSAVPHQSRIGSGWRAHHHVHQDTALRRGLPARLRGVQRKGVPHVHPCSIKLPDSTVAAAPVVVYAPEHKTSKGIP